MHTSRPALALIATAALLFPTLAACSSDSEGGSGGDTAGGESYSIGISQLVQHLSLIHI